jgi:hypothetical protein
MQLYTTIMIKYSRIFITILLAVIAFGAKAQSTSTTSSPYSQYGLGDIDPQLLPQNVAMGGIATAINRISLYNNINPLNPASYALINFTTIDAGIYSSIATYSQTGQPSSTNSNFRFSHVVFGIPVTKRSALSFGLLPYSEMGYNYKKTATSFGSGLPTDTSTVNYVYNGDGGLSKAYLGYGFAIGKHLYLGANVSYIFGDLQQFSSTQIPTLYGMLNPQIEQSNSIGGVNYDIGAQYSFDFGEYNTQHLVLGYAGQAGTKLNSTTTYIVSQFTYTAAQVANVAADSIVNVQNYKSTIQLPQINHFGISFQNDGHFLVGADYTMGHWSSLSIGGVNQGFQDSKTFNFGGEFTPDLNALHNYFSRVDYRAGFMYDESYLNLFNTDIKSYALTFGLGFPLAPNNIGTTFYKINFAAEVGQRGTVVNGLVRENYVNIHLSFVLNDKWFQKYKFE